MRVLFCAIALAGLMMLGTRVQATDESASPGATASTTQPASVMLEKAIYTEETVGDVDSAIKMYRQIVEQDADNRKYAAEAQYRLGQAYLKKKDPKQALTAFKELVTKFPDQRQTVVDAKKQINTLKAQIGDVSDLGAAVVKASPEVMSENVDPTLDKISVTFDQKMRDHSWSWTGGGETFPEIKGTPSYDESLKTCTLPVKLKPGTVYWVGINSPSFKNFTSATGQPAQRYVILFATKGSDGKPTKIPDEMKRDTKAVNATVGKPQPVVMKTSPAALAQNVSPKLKQITVTFDQPMMNGNWSWTGGGDTFPKLTGKPSYDAGRMTCRLPVELQPGKVYWIGINSPSFQNFQNGANVPAKRYAIVFATASADGKPTPIPDDMLKEANEINADSGSPAVEAATSAPAKEKP